MKPYIVTTGNHGRCVVYGYAAEEPQPGQPCRLERARMILVWAAECEGLFGLAAKGPRGDTRLTPAVAATSMRDVAQVIAVTPEAAAAVDQL